MDRAAGGGRLARLSPEPKRAGEDPITSNTSNTSNTSKTTNTSNAGNSAGDPGGGWGYANRVNLPFVDEPGTGIPSDSEMGNWPVGFDRRNWSPVWYAWVALTEFVRLDLSNLDPGGPVNENGGAADTDEEIKALIDLARFERADALGEIMAQKDEFISYFMGLLNATPSSHPETFRLLHMANLFATVAAMKFKSKYNRPRPIQIASVLLGPASPPGHASYPSGHAAQAMLMAQWAAELLSADTRWDAMRGNLERLAARIARNREIAGFHYESDSRGGRTLAAKIGMAIANDAQSPSPKMPSVHLTRLHAKAEWS